MQYVGRVLGRETRPGVRLRDQSLCRGRVDREPQPAPAGAEGRSVFEVFSHREGSGFPSSRCEGGNRMKIVVRRVESVKPDAVAGLLRR